MIQLYISLIKNFDKLKFIIKKMFVYRVNNNKFHHLKIHNLNSIQTYMCFKLFLSLQKQK
jgi:hypothetical protein